MPGRLKFRLRSLPSDTLDLFLVLVEVSDRRVEEVVDYDLEQLVMAVLEEHVEPGIGLLALDIQ